MLTLFSRWGFATKLKAAQTKKTKDSAGRRLGVKVYGDQKAYENEILIRQRGYQFHMGENTHSGKDHTIHASAEGTVQFTRDPYRKRKKIFVHVVRHEHPNNVLFNPPPFVYHPEIFPELAPNNPKPVDLDMSYLKRKDKNNRNP